MCASIGRSSLAELARIRPFRSRRESSWDRTGGNKDNRELAAGERLVMAQLKGPGCVKHIWITMGTTEKYYLRKTLLRFFWDGEEIPSVETPAGDFFGIGHGLLKSFVSLPLSMSPDGGRGFNCFFPMPFESSARLELINQGNEPLVVFFHIDWEQYSSSLEEDLGRFHAQWRRENPTEVAFPVERDKPIFIEGPQWGLTDYGSQLWSMPNLTGRDNYIILEAKGRGHYVGCNLNIDSFEPQVNDWYGEGDDMIFIDGESFPPSLHGTGTEDYFCMAYCPRREFCTPYYGLTLYPGEKDGRLFAGKHSMYRFHIEDPIHFDKSIKVTIEHGHNNKLANDYSSTAYWYQSEPHAPFPEMPPVEKRLPGP